MTPGAIVGAGTLTQPLGHAFRRGEGFPFWTIAAIHRGAFRVRSRGHEAVVRAGELSLVRPGTPYDVRLEGAVAWRETWIIFAPRPEWRELLAWPELLPGLLIARPPRASAGEGALAELERAQRWSAEGSARGARLAVNALERALLLAADPAGERDGLHPAVRAALALLAPGPAEAIDLPTLARRAGASPSHLAHLFTAQVGEPPMRWLERRRLDRARQLLIGGDRPIKSIAADCGFANQFHFSTRFRARFGVSPRAYRRDPRAVDADPR